jgi:hypothetical protein
MSKKNKFDAGKKVKVTPIIMIPIGFQIYSYAGNTYKIRLVQDPENRSFVITTENEEKHRDLEYVYAILGHEVIRYFTGNGDFELLPSEVKDDIRNSKV